MVVPNSCNYLEDSGAHAVGVVSAVSARLAKVAGNRFLYGPTRRKQRQDFCTAFAFSLCNTDVALCQHTWLPVLDGKTQARGGFYAGIVDSRISRTLRRRWRATAGRVVRP